MRRSLGRAVELRRSKHLSTTPSSPHLNAFKALVQWSEACAPEEATLPAWRAALSDVALHWSVASSGAARALLAEPLRRDILNGFRDLLDHIKRSRGPLFADMSLTVSQALFSVSDPVLLLDKLNALQDEGDSPLELPQLSLERGQLGAVLIEQLLGMRGQSAIQWGGTKHHRGILLLPLFKTQLSDLERFCLISEALDALATLHGQRLEPSQGFAPELMTCTHRFQVIAPTSLPTQISALQSPELKAGTGGGKASDVWIFARLALPLFSGGGASRSTKEILATLPVGLARPLERCIEVNPEKRFFSARELRVVIEAPLQSLIGELSYEAERALQEGEALLPYEELATQREELREERLIRQRKYAFKYRKRKQLVSFLRQIMVISLLGALIWGGKRGYEYWRAQKDEVFQTRLEHSLARSERLTQRDQTHQETLPKGLADVGFQWREVATEGELDPFLISVSEVTFAQYQVCVDAGVCATMERELPCTLASSPRGSPLNCVSFENASTFAQFVGGSLPLIDQWTWAATRDGAQGFPWGNDPLSSDYAHILAHGLEVVELLAPVCSYRLGDSQDGLCDLVGSLNEWVIITPAQDPQTRLGLNVGVIGGGWLTPPREVSVQRATRRTLETRDHDIGFRVVKALPRPPEKEDPKKEESAGKKPRVKPRVKPREKAGIKAEK